MASTLYDLSVSSFLQNIAGLASSLEKGSKFFTENKIDPKVVLNTRLYPNMLPFKFQIVSVCHHSIGAIKALKQGIAKTPEPFTGNYFELQKMLSDAKAELEVLNVDEVNGLVDKDVVFHLGDLQMPFVSQDFIRTFSLPNFYFHSTTAHDILRTIGVPIGKRDYLGIPKMKG